MAFLAGAFADFSNIGRGSIISEHAMLVSALHRVRSRSMNNINNISHGVHVGAGSYVLFEESYPSSADENIPRNDSIDIDTSETGEDIIFKQLSGNSSTTGIIKLNSGEKTVTITEAGLVEW